MKNPYRVTVGEIPEKYIESKAVSGILDIFCNEGHKMLILSGPSGSGKTVAMTVVAKELNKNKD